MSDEADDTTGAPTDEEVILRTGPSLRPTAVLTALVLVAGAAMVAGLSGNPTLLGEFTPAAARVVGLATVVAVLGLAARMYVLSRTDYVVTTDAVRRRYRFFLREKERRLPFAQVRATELDRGRVEALLGYGSLRFLTGGTNRSLGFVDFRSVPEPRSVYDDVQPLLEED